MYNIKKMKIAYFEKLILICSNVKTYVVITY